MSRASDPTGILPPITGRVWVFGDRVNTDELYPGFAMKLSFDEAARHMFHATRPGWADDVDAGDIVVGGRSFGMGSSRPVPLLFKSLGVACILADQFNSLFFRNCVNYGLPALSAPGVTQLFAEGEVASVDLAAGRIENTTRGTSLDAEPLPRFVVDIVQAGGLISRLTQQGLVLASEDQR